MLEEFREHIDQNFPFLKNSKVIIACSGGLDSVVLSYLCIKSGLQIAFAHCNFKLRGEESDGDEAFVRTLGNENNVPVFVNHFEAENYGKVKQLSIQMAARELRYDWFRTLVAGHDYDYVLTAHHADDNLETFLINLSRGSGIEGLTGIPTRNEHYIRPLLPFSRQEIALFAKERNISWREDSSNKRTKYLRNKLRHDVVPVLKEINPVLLQNFKKTISYLQDSTILIKDTIKKLEEELFEYDIDEEGIIRISISKLKNLGTPRVYLYHLLKDFGFSAWEDILQLLDGQSGKQVLSATYRLIKDRDYLLLAPTQSDDREHQYQVFEDETAIILPDRTLKFKGVEAMEVSNQHIIYVDKEKLVYPLHMRKWKQGDYFYPLGMQGKKKLSKFFKDEKLSLLDKEQVWVLCSANEIVWITGYRGDERFKVTTKTKEILKITVTR